MCNCVGNHGPYPPLSELPPWVAAAHNEIGYGILTQSADGNTLTWNYYVSETNQVLDTMVMTKK